MSISITGRLGTSEGDSYTLFQNELDELLVNLNRIIFIADRSYTNVENSDYDRKLTRVKSQTKTLRLDVNKFFSENKKYISYNFQGRDSIQTIHVANQSLPQDNSIIKLEDLNQVSLSLKRVLEFYRTIKEIAARQKMSDELIENLEVEVEKAKETVKQVESAKRALDGQKTEEIYSEASNRFLESARTYEVLFYMLLGGAVLVTIISLSLFPLTDKNLINFILFKVLTITLVLTLGTLFLRKAAHLRKLHEQAHQTSLELRALPLYLAEVEKAEHSGIYKELVSKYFGKELDKTQHDKIGDLMNEQIKTSLDVFKTSTEIVKSLKPNLTVTTSANPKDPKNTTEN